MYLEGGQLKDQEVYTWRETLQKDIEVLEAEEGLALDQAIQKRLMTSLTPSRER